MDVLQTLRDVVVMADVITQLLVTGLLALGGFVVSRYVLGRVHVRRLTSSEHDDFDAFYELCQASFTEDELEPKSEMARYLDDSSATQAGGSRFEDYFAVVKKGSRVCGLINATIYPLEHIGFINYMATDQDDKDARRIGSPRLLKAVRARMRRLGCRAILYEIEVLSPELSPHENDWNRTKAKLFISSAARNGAPTFELPIEYVQPELSVIDGYQYKEVPLSLMYVPLENHPGQMNKKEMSALLKVVLLQWYLDIYDEPGEHREKYEAYLTVLHERLMRDAPENIVLKRATKSWMPPMRKGGGGATGRLRKGMSPARRRRQSRAPIRATTTS